jgi:hypothetical protein
VGEKQSAMSTSKSHAAVEQKGKPRSRNAIADPAWLAWKRANSPGPLSLGGIPTNPKRAASRVGKRVSRECGIVACLDRCALLRQNDLPRGREGHAEVVTTQRIYAELPLESRDRL